MFLSNVFLFNVFPSNLFQSNVFLLNVFPSNVFLLNLFQSNVFLFNVFLFNVFLFNEFFLMTSCLCIYSRTTLPRSLPQYQYQYLIIFLIPQFSSHSLKSLISPYFSLSIILFPFVHFWHLSIPCPYFSSLLSLFLLSIIYRPWSVWKQI